MSIKKIYVLGKHLQIMEFFLQAEKGIKIFKNDKNLTENNDPTWEYYIIKYKIDELLNKNERKRML